MLMGVSRDWCINKTAEAQGGRHLAAGVFTHVLLCLAVLQGILFGSLHIFEQLVLPPVDKQQADR
jgi:hypothetical protein